MESPGKRLRWAREQAGYKYAADFARKIGVDSGTYRHHENETQGRRIPADKLALYSSELDVSTHWILTGDNQPEGVLGELLTRSSVCFAIKLTLTELNELEPPLHVTQLEKIIDPKRERILVPVSTDNAAAIEMPDESMSRSIPSAMQLIVDFDDTELVDKKTYIIRHGRETIVRRYRQDGPRSWFEADSFHKAHDNVEMDKVDHVLGRVVAKFEQM